MVALLSLVRRGLAEPVRRILIPWLRARGDGVMTGREQFQTVIADLSIAWARVVTEAEIRRIATRTGKAVDAANKAGQLRLLEGHVGVDALRGFAPLPRLLPQWIADHTALIVRGGGATGKLAPLGEEAIAQIGEAVQAGWRAGLRHETIAAQVQGRVGVAEARARLIARDQVGKLNGRLTAERQRAVGFSHFRWSTARDERVRQEHSNLEGETFAWASPPPIGLPGEPIQCRCTAIPAWDEAGGAL